MVGTPFQQQAQPPGSEGIAGGDPLIFDRGAARDADRVQPFLGDVLSPYDAIKGASSTQITSYWDSFDGLASAVTGGATNVRNQYRISATDTVRFSPDATTGRTYFITGTSAALNATSIIFVGDGTDQPFQPRAAENWQMKFLVAQNTAPVGGTQVYEVGLRDAVATGGAPSNGIFFLSTNAGNWFLVCRSANVESTLDMAVAPGSALQLLEFRVSNDGGLVTGYLNGRRVGTVSSNIPTARLFVSCRHENRAITVTTAGRLRLYGWGWKGELGAAG